MENQTNVRKLLEFIAKSPTAYQAVDSIADMLDAAGAVRLYEHETWQLEAGQTYYVVRNGSAAVAFSLPETAADRFMIAATHTDSPTFKLKPIPEQEACGAYIRLATERYGGMILSSWLDRPLSLAGRVIVREDGRFSARSVVVGRDLVLIPNTCVHFNREINDGYRYNPASDMLPLFAAQTGKGKLPQIIADAAGVQPEQIVTSDLYLYERTPGSVWGADGAFFSAPRIDNLMCTYGALRGFLAAEESCAVKVFAALDNEETGSQSRQGAGSMFVRDVLEAVAAAQGKPLGAMLAQSMLLSADNAHARHPNRPDLSDSGENAPLMNGGVVIKHNAAQRYTTDALSDALFAEICRRADIPTQHFSNRSDLAGGSTLGGILNGTVAPCSVDVGMAQLAMHSCYETAGCADVSHIINACTAFYGSALSVSGDDILLV